MNRHEKGRVLSFARDAEFYYAKYEKLADQGDLLGALVALRKATEMEPEDVDFQLDLAELYTELCHFEESCYLLLRLLEKHEDCYGDCIFGLGCNFFGLRDLKKARECFSQYAAAFPDGSYLGEARDFLYMIEEEEQADAADPNAEAWDMADRGKDLLDQGDYDGAVKVFTEVDRRWPDLPFVRNNLALAHYCRGELDEAVRISDHVLFRDPRDIGALCNRLLFRSGEGELPETLQDELKVILALTPADVDECIKVALTCCELREHEQAYRALLRVAEDLPYDERTLFLLGASAVNSGRVGEGLRYFVDLLRLAPEDTVALYYKNLVQAARARGDKVYVEYTYQVPMHELRRRMDYLNECVQQGPKVTGRLWRRDERFRKMLLWALTLSDVSVKRLVIELLSSFEDERAAEAIKRYLLRPGEPDVAKNEALLALRRLHVPQPYVASVAGKIVEVRVGVMDRPDWQLRPSNVKVIDRVISEIGSVAGREYLPGVVETVSRYLAAQSAMPIMRNSTAWAAAFIWAAAQAQSPGRFSKNEIARRMGVSPSSLDRCLKKITAALAEE